MANRPMRPNLRPLVWLVVSVIAFAVGLALGSVVLVLVASLALVGALVTVRRFPGPRD